MGAFGIRSIDSGTSKPIMAFCSVIPQETDDMVYIYAKTGPVSHYIKFISSTSGTFSVTLDVWG
jgi:hypothetical protein